MRTQLEPCTHRCYCAPSTSYPVIAPRQSRHRMLAADLLAGQRQVGATVVYACTMGHKSHNDEFQDEDAASGQQDWRHADHSTTRQLSTRRRDALLTGSVAAAVGVADLLPQNAAIAAGVSGRRAMGRDESSMHCAHPCKAHSCRPCCKQTCCMCTCHVIFPSALTHKAY